MPDPTDSRPLLRDQHYGLTDAAVRAYAEHQRLDHEAARADLERILGDARQSPTNPDHWRLRSRATGLDISIVTREDDERGHRVVTALSIRESGGGIARGPSYAARQLRRAAARESVPESGRAAPLSNGDVGDDDAGPRDSARPGARVVVAVPMSEAEHAEIHAERREGETVADVLRASGLATARARRRAAKRPK